MKRLKHQDWKNLFSALSILHSDIEPETLGERCVAAMNTLVSAEITAFDFFNDKGIHTGKYWYDPPDSISEAEFEIFAHVAHEHPFAPDVFGKRRFEGLKISDYLTSNQFHRTAIYNEYYKIYRIDHQLIVAFADTPNSIITCAYSRTKNNFSEEERLITNLIARHLETAFQNAHKLEAFHKNEAVLNSALELKSSGVIVLSSGNRIVYESQFARQMLEKYFSGEKVETDDLPESLSRWLKIERGKIAAASFSPPVPIFNVENEFENLKIRLMSNHTTRETTLLFEESSKPILEISKKLKLTPREREILFWISQGKTNKEIGILIGTSSRTVNKHTENIYFKLGVENRTTAASIALGFFSE